MRDLRVYRFMTVFLTLLSLAAATPAAAQTNPAPVPFHPGERLEYAVSYGVIPAGSMSIRVAGLEEYQGRQAYHFVLEAKSNRAVSFVFDFATQEEAWFDAEALHSLRHRQFSIENDKERRKDIVYDQARNLRIENGEAKPASPHAVDPVSMVYYLRTLTPRVGASYVLRNQSDPANNPVTVRILKKERIRVPAGTFETYLVDLDVRTNQGFFKKGGENRIWVTADDRRIPVKISSKVGLGSFQAELVELSTGG